MLAKFYLVEKNGVAAVWQSAPSGMARLLKNKEGYSVVPSDPSNTRAEALTKLRELFPGSRPLRDK